MCKKSLLLLFLLPFQLVFAQTSLLTDFPEGYTPKEVGKRLAYHFVDGKHMLHIGKWISYPETFTWNGGLKFAALTNDQELVKLLQNRFELLFTTEKALLPIKNHVDVNMFGSLPLELYKITKDQRYLDLGLPYADTQWQLPENAKPKEKEWDQKGYSWQTRLWIDDMYMITIVQTQAYRVTGDRKYIDRAAREMVMYLDELQCPNGLFYHASDVPFYWGRGNGWMAAGMAELLSSLPEDSEYRLRILHGYRTMMKSLKKYQSSNGLWHQLLDHPDCWIETSGSAMFTFAFIKGVKNGWLDARTKIVYPAVFDKSVRQVAVDGEAYFDVAKDKKRPFIVETGKCNMEVLGTKFNVEGYSDKDDFEVTLMEGSVRVASRIGLGDTLMLKPDSKACLQKDGRLKVIPVDDYNPYRWKEGLICFRNESFLSIMNDLEKYFGVSIVVENKNVLKYYFTGKFRQADGIDYALRVLQRDIRFKYERDDENQIIYIR